MPASGNCRARSPRCLRSPGNAKTQRPQTNILPSSSFSSTPFTSLLLSCTPYTHPTSRGLQKTVRFSSFNTGVIFLTRPFLQTLEAPSTSPSPCLFWLPEPWSSRPRTRWRAHPRKRQPSFETARPNFLPTHNAPRPHRQWRQWGWEKPQREPAGDKISGVTQSPRLLPRFLFLLWSFLSHWRKNTSVAKKGARPGFPARRRHLGGGEEAGSWRARPITKQRSSRPEKPGFRAQVGGVGQGECEDLLEAVREWCRQLDRERSSATAATWVARTRNTRRRAPRRSGLPCLLPEPNPPRLELPERPQRSLCPGRPQPPLPAPGSPGSSKVWTVRPRTPPELQLPVPREKLSHVGRPSILKFISHAELLSPHLVALF